jgi:hypothetical protein
MRMLEAGLLTCRSLRNRPPSHSEEQWLFLAGPLAAHSGATVRELHPLPSSPAGNSSGNLATVFRNSTLEGSGQTAIGFQLSASAPSSPRGDPKSRLVGKGIVGLEEALRLGRGHLRGLRRYAGWDRGRRLAIGGQDTILPHIGLRRNEANFGFGGRLGWGGQEGGVGVLKAAQFLESTIVRALGGIDAALQADAMVAGAEAGKAERIGLFIVADAIGVIPPKLGFDCAEAAELPLGADQFVDEEAGDGSGGLELLMIFGDQAFEFVGIFAGNDHGAGMDAGLEGVEAGDGLTLGGAGAGGEPGVATIRLDLKLRCHKQLSEQKDNRATGASRRGEYWDDWNRRIY